MSVYMQNKNIIFRQEGDEAIIFNPDTAAILVINSTGCLIWSMCDGKNTRQDIIHAMLDEFEVSRSRAEEDADKFLGNLEKINFVEKRAGYSIGEQKRGD